MQITRTVATIQCWDAVDLSALSRIARKMASRLRPGDVFLLEGHVGAGKSTLVRHILRSLSRDPILVVPSPTYLIDIPYDIPGPSSALTVHHVDLFRLGSQSAPFVLSRLQIPFATACCLVEWPSAVSGFRDLVSETANVCTLLIEEEQVEAAISLSAAAAAARQMHSLASKPGAEAGVCNFELELQQELEQEQEREPAPANRRIVVSCEPRFQEHFQSYFEPFSSV